MEGHGEFSSSEHKTQEELPKASSSACSRAEDASELSSEKKRQREEVHGDNRSCKKSRDSETTGQRWALNEEIEDHTEKEELKKDDEKKEMEKDEKNGTQDELRGALNEDIEDDNDSEEIEEDEDWAEDEDDYEMDEVEDEEDCAEDEVLEDYNENEETEEVGTQDEIPKASSSSFSEAEDANEAQSEHKPQREEVGDDSRPCKKDRISETTGQRGTLTDEIKDDEKKELEKDEEDGTWNNMSFISENKESVEASSNMAAYSNLQQNLEPEVNLKQQEQQQYNELFEESQRLYQIAAERCPCQFHYL